MTEGTIKDIIKAALIPAIAKLERSVPFTKKVTKSISITDVKPSDLPVFMAENDIPSSAWFDGRDNGYDAWDDILLSWDVEVPTEVADTLAFRNKRFDTLAFKSVYDHLIKVGYKRRSYDSRLFKEFKDTTVYKMYMGGEFDRITEYYSLYFKLES